MVGTSPGQSHTIWIWLRTTSPGLGSRLRGNDELVFIYEWHLCSETVMRLAWGRGCMCWRSYLYTGSAVL